MTLCSKSPHRLLKLIYISLLPALQAQEVRVQPKVTGYLGHDVTLLCQFIKGSQVANITQFQWDLKTPAGEKITILVNHVIHGVDIPETSMKGRVEVADQSLIIKDVKMSDAGTYICNIAAFPSGSFEGTTTLDVREQLPLSSGVVAAIVTAALLLVVIMAASTYLLFIRRRNSSLRQPGTSGQRMYTPGAPGRDGDLVYADVKFKPSREVNASSNDKHTETVHATDVTYSEVNILKRQSKREEEMFI